MRCLVMSCFVGISVGLLSCGEVSHPLISLWRVLALGVGSAALSPWLHDKVFCEALCGVHAGIRCYNIETHT